MPLDNSAEFANHIPEAIRRQSQRADEIAREVGVANVPELDGGTTVVEPVQPPAPAAVEPPPAAPPPATDWEQKFKTLQGKYDSEAPALRNQVASLERVLSTIQTARPEPVEPAPAPAPATTTVVIPEKDVEEFGPDLIAAARRWARAEFDQELTALRADFNALKGEIGKVGSTQQQTVTMTARQSAMLGLDNDPELGAPAPNGVRAGDGTHQLWRVVNDDQSFTAWLNQADPFSGQPRMRLLREAFDAGNSARMKVIFKAFLTEQTVTQGSPAPSPSHTPAPGTAGPSLESLAAPGRSNGPVPVGAPAEKRVWTHNDITAFYRDVNKGVYAERPADKLRLEQDIFLATREGRIR